MSDEALHQQAFRFWATGLRQADIARRLEMSESMISRWRTGSVLCDCPWHKWESLVESGALPELDQGSRDRDWRATTAEKTPKRRPGLMRPTEVGNETVLGICGDYAIPAEVVEGVGPGKNEGTGAPADAPIAEMLLESIRGMARFLTWEKIRGPDGRHYYMPKVPPQSAKEAASVMRDVLTLREMWLRHKAGMGVSTEEHVKPVEERVAELSDDEIAREMKLLQGGKTATG